tara:strand:+ start:976 stop:1122 length:147 start_codon:yes stop_codon:yes gene_type:complete
MTQEEINKALSECIEGLSEAIRDSSKSRDVMLKLIQLLSERIDSLENR